MWCHGHLWCDHRFVGSKVANTQWNQFLQMNLKEPFDDERTYNQLFVCRTHSSHWQHRQRWAFENVHICCDIGDRNAHSVSQLKSRLHALHVLSVRSDGPEENSQIWEERKESILKAHCWHSWITKSQVYFARVDRMGCMGVDWNWNGRVQFTSSICLETVWGDWGRFWVPGQWLKPLYVYVWFTKKENVALFRTIKLGVE